MRIRRLAFLFLFLLPALLGAGVRVNKQVVFQQPVGWIDRVSKRTQHTKVLQDAASFNGTSTDTIYQMVFSPIVPLHYDSAGSWKNLSVETMPDTTGLYHFGMRTGRWIVNIDTVTGAFGFQRDKGSRRGVISFTPAFTPTTVPTEYVVSPTGIKSTYTLNVGNRLAWSYDYTNALDTTGAQGKGKGRIKNSLNQIRAEISDFTVNDANGNKMPVKATWTDDSLVVELTDTMGYTRPFIIDPSVKDSTNQAIVGNIYRSVYMSSSWGKKRQGDGTNSTLEPGNALVGVNVLDGYTNRAFLKVCFDSSMAVTQVDSAKILINRDSPAGTPWASMILGTQTGVASQFWWNDFAGWSSDSTANWNVIRLANDTILTNGTFNLNQTGKDSIKAVMNRNDTLKVAFVDPREFSAARPAGGGQMRFTYVIFSVFFRLGNPPGVSTVTDSLKPAVELVVNVDSTGGINGTIATFMLWPKGATLLTDTIVRTKTGSFGVGLIKMYVDSLLADTLYRWKMSLQTGSWTSWTPQDSFTTTLSTSSSTAIKVMGRSVNTSVR